MGRPSRLARLKRRNKAKRLKKLEWKKRSMGFSNIFTAIQELCTEGAEMEDTNLCKVCGKPDRAKPMCFQGAEWCSEQHRKQILGDSPQKRH